MELGRAVFRSGTVPVVVGARTWPGRSLRQPVRGGRCVWYRIDRHPTMRHHPVTPMTEADLRLHLAQQTKLPWTHRPDCLPVADCAEALAERNRRAHRRRCFRRLLRRHARRTARILWERAAQRAIFAVGSSVYAWAVASLALGRTNRRGAGARTCVAHRPAPRVSGSCSPVTARQIRRAKQMGLLPGALKARSHGAIQQQGSSSSPERPQCRALHALGPQTRANNTARNLDLRWAACYASSCCRAACAGFSSPAAIRRLIP